MDALTGAEPQEAQIIAIADRLDKRAGQARQTAAMSFALTMLIGIAILSLFLFSGAISNIISPISSPDSLRGLEVAPAITASYVLDLSLRAGVSIIARIGAVLVGIFLIQILVGFSRYNYRLGTHLSECADIVRIGRCDATIMKELAPFMLSTIDFGKIPSSPFQKMVDKSMDTIREVVKKIPEK
jgi:hypothetical protein